VNYRNVVPEWQPAGKCPICNSSLEDMGGMVAVAFELDRPQQIYHGRKYVVGYRTGDRLVKCSNAECGLLFARPAESTSTDEGRAPQKES
jgi:hypothetical protein